VKWLCDEMLGELARWLRSAGHDTALAEQGASDAVILARCADEDRVLITRDRSLASRAANAVLLNAVSLDAQAHQLKCEHGVDWRLAPFTRCMIDNAPLFEANDDDLARIPQQSRDLPGPFRVCPTCARVYWPGSHFRRMDARLSEWSATNC